MPPDVVKAYIKRNKNDVSNAKAIFEVADAPRAWPPGRSSVSAWVFGLYEAARSARVNLGRSGSSNLVSVSGSNHGLGHAQGADLAAFVVSTVIQTRNDIATLGAGSKASRSLRSGTCPDGNGNLGTPRATWRQALHCLY
jgi:hypothetical protein